MKIWAGDLKFGDSFYYECLNEIKHGTIVDANQGVHMMMTYWNLDNGDIVTHNTWVADSPEDFIDDIIDELKKEIEKSKSTISLHEEYIKRNTAALEKYTKMKDECKKDSILD